MNKDRSHAIHQRVCKIELETLNADRDGLSEEDQIVHLEAAQVAANQLQALISAEIVELRGYPPAPRPPGQREGQSAHQRNLL